jgi:hypothetical protein
LLGLAVVACALVAEDVGAVLVHADRISRPPAMAA